MKLHHRTIGTAKRNAGGLVVNAVLLLQGNTGTGANWFRPSLADELFKAGQPLDPAKYYIIMPDARLAAAARRNPPMIARHWSLRFHSKIDNCRMIIESDVTIVLALTTIRRKSEPTDVHVRLRHCPLASIHS
jgi:hypothetical protein